MGRSTSGGSIPLMFPWCSGGDFLLLNPWCNDGAGFLPNPWWRPLLPPHNSCDLTTATHGQLKPQPTEIPQGHEDHESTLDLCFFLSSQDNGIQPEWVVSWGFTC